MAGNAQLCSCSSLRGGGGPRAGEAAGAEGAEECPQTSVLGGDWGGAPIRKPAHHALNALQAFHQPVCSQEALIHPRVSSTKRGLYAERLSSPGGQAPVSNALMVISNSGENCAISVVFALGSADDLITPGWSEQDDMNKTHLWSEFWQE